MFEVLFADNIAIDAGQWFLSFFRDFVATPAILVGLFAMLGSILLRKKTSDIITAFFKTAAGFLIISGGAGIVSGSLANFQFLFEDLFGITGTIPSNDAFPGYFFNMLPQIAQLGSLIMVVSMVLNILLAYLSKFKYIFLSGHVLFYMSIMLASVMALSGFDLSLASDYTIALVASAVLMSCYMVLSCAMTSRYTARITGQTNIAVAHTGSLSYVMGGLIGDLIYKIKKGQNIRSTEAVNFPKGLQFFRNTFISMAITMLIVFLIVYVPEGIMYNLGIKELATIPAPDNTNLDLIAELTAKNNSLLSVFGPDAKVNWLVQCIVDAFTFAAGVEVILLGVRMVIGELVPSFKGISEKLIKNCKAGLDCPIVFPYAPNAVLIGFVSSIVGALVGLGISVGINAATGGSGNVNSIAIIIPGIVAQFFLGATTGVFGNSRGGIWGCVIGAFLNGIIITLIPIVFLAAKWAPTNAGLIWGDTDYALGFIPGLLTMSDNQVLNRWLVLAFPILVYVGLAVHGLVDRFVISKRKPTLNVNATNPTFEAVDKATVAVTAPTKKIKPSKQQVKKPVQVMVAAQPTVSKPAPKKVVAKKVASKPAAKTVTAKKVVSKPVVKTVKPAAKKPVAKKVIAKPAPKKVVAKVVSKPVVKTVKPAAKKPVAKKVVSKPVVKTVKPAAKKPVAKKPTNKKVKR